MTTKIATDDWEAKYRALASDVRDPAAIAAAEDIVRRATKLSEENHLSVAANVQMLIFGAQANDIPTLERLPAELRKWRWQVSGGFVRAVPIRR